MNRGRGWMVLTGVAAGLFAGQHLSAASSAGRIAQSSRRPATGASQPMSNPSAKPAHKVFRNLKVLGNIPAYELIPTMQYIAVALGVKCTFCHVEHAFWKDTKRPKRTARMMMRMLLAIDRNNFRGHTVVTCYTCHRGSAHPMGIPPLAGIAATSFGPRPSPAARAALPSAAVIESRYRHALGGAAALAGVRTLVETGTMGKASIRIERRAPNLERMVVSQPHGQFASGYDGHTVWQRFGPRREILGGAQRAQAIAAAELFPALHMTRGFVRLRVAGIVSLNGRPAYHLLGMRRGGGFEQLFFGQKSGLLRRAISYTPNPLGVVPQATDYADYRAVSGSSAKAVKIPFQITNHQPQGVSVIKLAAARVNQPIPQHDFAPPPMKPARRKPPAH